MTNRISQLRCTPGDWLYLANGDNTIYVCGPGQEPVTIAEVEFKMDDEEEVANGHMLAAAKRLYAQLVEARHIIATLMGRDDQADGMARNCLVQIDVELAKARGDVSC